VQWILAGVFVAALGGVVILLIELGTRRSPKRH
jgi:hypothetical protein